MPIWHSQNMRSQAMAKQKAPEIDISFTTPDTLHIQTVEFCHVYDDLTGSNMLRIATQCAGDIDSFLESGVTTYWAGNEPEYRIDPDPDSSIGRKELEAIIAAGGTIRRISGYPAGLALVFRLLGYEIKEAPNAVESRLTIVALED